MKFHWRSLAAAAALLLLTSCGSEGGSQGGSSATGYKDTKSMVMDILKSDEGRKAVQVAAYGTDTTASERPTGIKTLSVGDAKQLQLAVKDVLTDQQNSTFLQNLMKDPKFAGDFAKAVQKENKQLLKDLMKDPEYQKLQLDTMKNPEYQTILLDTMRGMQYRQHVMSIIQESMQSPLFKTEMINMLKKAIEEGTMAQAQTAQGGGQQGGGKGGKGGGDGGGGKGGGKGGGQDGGDGGSSDGGDSSDSSDDQDDTKKKQKSSSGQ
jgi:spore germination protein D